MAPPLLRDGRDRAGAHERSVGVGDQRRVVRAALESRAGAPRIRRQLARPSPATTSAATTRDSDVCEMSLPLILAGGFLRFGIRHVERRAADAPARIDAIARAADAHASWPAVPSDVPAIVKVVGMHRIEKAVGALRRRRRAAGSRWRRAARPRTRRRRCLRRCACSTCADAGPFARAPTSTARRSPRRPCSRTPAECSR